MSLVSYDTEKNGTPWILLDIPVGTSGRYPIFSWTCKRPLKWFYFLVELILKKILIIAQITFYCFEIFRQNAIEYFQQSRILKAKLVKKISDAGNVSPGQ